MFFNFFILQNKKLFLKTISKQGQIMILIHILKSLCFTFSIKISNLFKAKNKIKLYFKPYILFDQSEFGTKNIKKIPWHECHMNTIRPM